MADHRIEMMRLSDIRGAERNPKQHDIKRLLDSLDRFGFVAPATMNEETGRLVAGHGRVEALQHRKAMGLPPPARIEVDESGEWLVPVLRGISFESAREAEAYLLADNRLQEAGGWNEAELLAMLGDIQKDTANLDGVGWDSSDLEALAGLAGVGKGDEPDKFDPNSEWQGMPEFSHEDKMGLSIIVRFKDEEAKALFEQTIGKKLPDKAKYLWFPGMEIERFADKRYISEGKEEAAQALTSVSAGDEEPTSK